MSEIWIETLEGGLYEFSGLKPYAGCGIWILSKSYHPDFENWLEVHIEEEDNGIDTKIHAKLLEKIRNYLIHAVSIPLYIKISDLIKEIEEEGNNELTR